MILLLWLFGQSQLGCIDMVRPSVVDPHQRSANYNFNNQFITSTAVAQNYCSTVVVVHAVVAIVGTELRVSIAS